MGWLGLDDDRNDGRILHPKNRLAQLGRAALAFLAILWCGAAAAFEFPALYNVTGVAENDSLNVRAEPSTDADIIGSLAYNAREVEVVDQSSDGLWARVNVGEGSGWAAFRYLRRDVELVVGQTPLTCFGTEPFWAVAIRDDDQIVLQTPSQPELVLDVQTQFSSINRTDRVAISAANEQTQMTALIAGHQCSDGMSDRLFGLTIDFGLQRSDVDPILLSGCCTMVP
ncbi:MAG: SH3 domain-containing protein [Pseudomonadota bacterium]